MDNQSSRSWKVVGIGGIVLLVIVILFEVIISKNAITSNNPAPSISVNANTSFGTSDWQKYSASQYGQTITFQYPPNYSVTKGGRPFNLNDEGTVTTFVIRCNNTEKCQDIGKDSVTIYIYENKKKWNIDEWIKKIHQPPLK